MENLCAASHAIFGEEQASDMGSTDVQDFWYPFDMCSAEMAMIA